MKGLKWLFAGLVLVSFSAHAQNNTRAMDTIYNTKGTEHIPYYEYLFKYRVWRTIDFREKQNMPFKSTTSDLIKLMIDNLFSGVLKGYEPTDLYFSEAQKADVFLVKNRQQGLAAYSATKDYYSQEKVSYEGKVYTSSANANTGHLPTDASWWAEVGEETEYLRSEDVPMVTLVEDVIFDRRRSRLYYDILGFILLNADGNPLAIVNFDEFSKLVDKLSHARDMKTRGSVMWKNAYNPAADKTYIDAFKLRDFHGVIEKVENPDDRTILELYTMNHQPYAESVFARWEEDMKMLEKEHNLWEY